MFECALLISCVINYNILPCRCSNKINFYCSAFLSLSQTAVTHTHKINFDCDILKLFQNCSLQTDICMNSGNIRTNSSGNYWK